MPVALTERAKAETEQLLAAARLQAEAVRVQSEATAQGLIQAAVLEAQALKAAAEREAGTVRQGAADQRRRHSLNSARPRNRPTARPRPCWPKRPSSTGSPASI